MNMKDILRAAKALGKDEAEVPQGLWGRIKAGLEEWRTIEGFPAYEVSSLGRVRRAVDGKGGRGRAKTGLLLKLQTTKGYTYAQLYAEGHALKTKSIDFLVASAFLPNPNNYTKVRRLGEASDHRACMLEWQADIPTVLPCAECGREFEGIDPQRWNFNAGKNVYCSSECVAAVSARTMAATNHKYASARMTENNPMTNPDSVKKMKQTLRRIGHKPRVRGGNGTGLTLAEKTLSEATGLLPCIVRTGMSRYSGYPNHYKLDLADPEHMLGIEVDGNSHGLLSRQAQDRKKTAFLEALGWTILRFTNQRVLEEVEKCCEIIKTTASTLSSRTT